MGVLAEPYIRDIEEIKQAYYESSLIQEQADKVKKRKRKIADLEELCKENGLTFEVHQVETEDDFLLRVFRIR